MFFWVKCKMKYSRTSQGCTSAGFYGNCRAVFSAVVSLRPALCFQPGEEGRVRTVPKGGLSRKWANISHHRQAKSLSLRRVLVINSSPFFFFSSRKRWCTEKEKLAAVKDVRDIAYVVTQPSDLSSQLLSSGWCRWGWRNEWKCYCYQAYKLMTAAAVVYIGIDNENDGKSDKHNGCVLLSNNNNNRHKCRETNGFSFFLFPYFHCKTS